MHLLPEQLSELLDDELAPDARDEAQRHLASCAACSEELAALRALSQDLPALQVRSPDLWPKIREGVEARGWRRWLSEPRLAWGTSGLFAAATLSLLLVLFGRPTPSPKDELETTRVAYLAAIARLEGQAVTARSELPVNVRRKVADSLAAVDSAIADCEQMLEQNRADPESQKMLLALYEEKIRVLDATIAARPGAKK
ncbi:MAG: zf-HC2 domain-containing protein [Myxococcota bacterium]